MLPAMQNVLLIKGFFTVFCGKWKQRAKFLSQLMSDFTSSKILIKTLASIQCLMPLGIKSGAREGQYCSPHFLDKFWPIPAVLVSGKTPGNGEM